MRGRFSPIANLEDQTRAETVAKKPAYFGCFQQILSPPLILANKFVVNKYVGVLLCGQARNRRSWK